MAAPKLISIKTVCERTLYSRSSIHRLVTEGRFPKPLKCGPRKAAFVESEVDEHIAALIAVRGRGRA
jgi:prophage regulatory protein